MPGGSERYIEEVCLHLLKTGHTPVAYSSKLGIVSDSLLEKGILVVDDLRSLTFVPDVIHSHHHLDASYATAYFPMTPCVHFCHGIIPWEENPIQNTNQIYAYVAVSELTADKLMCSNVPPEKITVVPNWASSKFTYNSSARATRVTGHSRVDIKALIIANSKLRFDEAIDTACCACGIQLDKFGSSYGRSADNPEELIKAYDIVFCYGKSAMESIWSGADVILSCDSGFGGLVTDDNFDFFRSRNFGYTTCLNLVSSKDVEEILEICIDRIESGQLGQLSPMNRQKLDSGRGLRAITELLALAAGSQQPKRDYIETSIAIERSRNYADYIRFVQLSRMYKMPILEQKLAESEMCAHNAHQAMLEAQQRSVEAEQGRLEAENQRASILTSKTWRYSRAIAKKLDFFKRVKWRLWYSHRNHHL